MKFIAVVFFFVCASAYAQTEKFTMFVSGSFAYNRTGIDMNPAPNSGGFVARYQVETMNTMPTVGFMFTRRFAVGVIMPYQWRRVSNDYGTAGYNSNKDIMYRYGPMVEYYQPIYKGFYASAKAGFSWGNVSVIRENANPRNIVLTTKGVTVSGALMYFINKNFAAEILAVLTGDNSSEYDGRNTANFYTDHLNVQAGIKSFFGHSWKN